MQIMIYPNPIETGEELTITSTHKNQVFQFVDLQGRILPINKGSYSDGNNTTVLNLGNVSPGIYILRSEGIAWKIKVN